MSRWSAVSTRGTADRLRSSAMSGRLERRVALITGAGMGMGREACLVFSAEGVRIVALDIDPGPLEETAQSVTAAGGEILLHR